MISKALHVLLIEDSAADAFLIRDMLNQTTFGPVSLVHESRLRCGLAKLDSQPFDVLLLDLGLPDSFGIDTFLTAQTAAPHLAIVVLSGNNDESDALQAVQAGAQDYLVKGEVDGHTLGRAIRYAVKRMQITQELYEAKQEAELAAHVKSDFLASMSHELRTPLASIIGFTEVLLMRLPGPLTDVQERHLSNVEFSANHLLSLINDLLDLAKIESGKVKLSMELVNCRTVIEEVASSLSQLAERKGLRFEIRVPKEEILLNTDRRALSQIIINLSNNAIKFTTHGEVRLEVVQRHENGQCWTEFSVTDTGEGIRLKDQATLFDPFTQVTPDAGQLREGTGLGLNLSQKLAKLLGGEIVVESEHGEGSIFTLKIAEDVADFIGLLEAA